MEFEIRENKSRENSFRIVKDLTNIKFLNEDKNTLEGASFTIKKEVIVRVADLLNLLHSFKLDFSFVRYIADNGNTALGIKYKNKNFNIFKLACNKDVKVTKIAKMIMESDLDE